MNERRPFYQKLTAFNRLYSVVARRKHSEKVTELIQIRSPYWKAKKMFAQWTMLTKTIKKVRTKKIECIFNRFKTYAKIQKQKRISHDYYQKSLKIKMINTMYNKTRIIQRDFEATHRIQSNSIYRTKNQILKKWRNLYLKTSKDRTKIESYIRIKSTILLTSILTQWRSYSSHVSKVSKISSFLQSKSELTHKIRGFTTFVNGIVQIRSTNSKNKKADVYYKSIT
jgi:hypothetical protein